MKHLIWRLTGPLMASMALIGSILQGGVAQAAPEAQRTQQQSISFTFPQATFSSILGGYTTGSALLAGSLSADGQLSTLNGELNFPLKDPNLRVMPTAPVRVSASTFQSSWVSGYECDPFGCRPIYHLYTQTNTNSAVPVDIRSNSLHGNGNLSWSTSACSGDCPTWFTPGGSANLSGAVVSSQEAGMLNLYGPAPLIR